MLTKKEKNGITYYKDETKTEKILEIAFPFLLMFSCYLILAIFS